MSLGFGVKDIMSASSGPHGNSNALLSDHVFSEQCLIPCHLPSSVGDMAIPDTSTTKSCTFQYYMIVELPV